MEIARHLVGRGHGVGFFTRALVADDLQRGALAEVAVRDLPAIARDSALVRRLRAAPLSPAAAKLAALLHAEPSASASAAAAASKR